MEIIALLVSVLSFLIAIPNKKWSWTGRIILTFISSFGLYRFFKPGTFFLTDSNLWTDAIATSIKTGNWGISILLFAFCLAFFHGIIRWLIIRGGKFRAKQIEKGDPMRKRFYETLMVKFTRKLVLNGVNWNVLPIIQTTERHRVNINESVRSNQNFYSSLIHIVVCIGVIFHVKHFWIIWIITSFILFWAWLGVGVLIAVYDKYKLTQDQLDDLIENETITGI